MLTFAVSAKVFFRGTELTDHTILHDLQKNQVVMSTGLRISVGDFQNVHMNELTMFIQHYVCPNWTTHNVVHVTVHRVGRGTGTIFPINNDTGPIE